MGIALDKKRTVALIAHGGAGKTSLAEAMLFNAKATTRLGRVDDSTSILDHEPEEQKRKITLSASLHHYDLDKHTTTVIDTPGYSNFLTETRNSLCVADGAVVLLSAISGVKVQTEKVWEFADESDLPRIAFVNKMDKDKADSPETVADMEKVLKVKDVPLQLPIGQGEKFKGVVDLLSMKAYIYGDDLSGKAEITDIPGELKEEADKARETLMEAAVESDDKLTEKYLNGEEVSDEELKAGLRKGVVAGNFVPLLFGSAYKNMGVDLLMDAVNLCLPSPLDRAAVKGTDPKTGEDASREPSEDAPLSARVFKTVIDPYTGKLSIFKIYSGKLTGNASLLNSSTGVKEKPGHIFVLEGDKTKEVTEASCGDIVAVSKLKDTHTGNTLCDAESPIVLPPLPPANASLAFAITPKTKADEDKVPQGLHKLMEEDPALEFKRDEHTNEFLLSGVGQNHLEVAIEKLKRKYGCEVELKAPRIPYKETLRASTQVQGRYKKQSGGRGQFGDTWLEISPLPRGTGFEFVNNIVGGVIPRQYIPAVEKGIKEAMLHGTLAGYPVVDVKVRLYDGSHHSVDSSEMAFKIAGSMGFKKGVEQSRPVLLEPIVNMDIIVPEDHMGDIIGDINSRRGKILGVDPRGGSQVVKAVVPMAEVISYSTDLKGMTADRGLFTMEFSHYEEVPAHLSPKVIEAARAEKA
ncbi:MAG: elongation factor G [Thermodesulfobacteriota bacterium]